MELGGVKKFMEFLENEKIKTDKWENLMPIATNKYLRYFYELPKENSVLERQVKRIREDVKEHDKALGDILKELEK